MTRKTRTTRGTPLTYKIERGNAYDEKMRKMQTKIDDFIIKSQSAESTYV